MFLAIRHALSAAWKRGRSARARLASESYTSICPLYDTTFSADTLVATEASAPGSAPALTHTRVHTFGDLLAAIANKNKARANAVEHGSDADIANYEYNPDDFAAGNRYSILSIAYSDADCFSAISLDFDDDSDSNSSLGAKPEDDGKITRSAKPEDNGSSGTAEPKEDDSSHLESAANRGAANISTTSTDAMLAKALAVARIAEPLFDRLSDSDRSVATAALCVILDVNAGDKVPRHMYMKVYQVLFVAVRYQTSGDKTVAPEVLLMAAGIRWLGTGKAVHWLYPMIVDYCRTVIYDRGFGCGFA